MRSFVLRACSAVAAAVLLTITVAVAPALADGPPSAPPYPKIVVVGNNDGVFTCRDADGTLVYEDTAWTLEPLFRGPTLAPVVIWLPGLGNAPVVALEFDIAAFPMLWQTIDGGPAESGLVESAQGRPVIYGSPPTDSAQRVTCSYDKLGHHLFGTYLVTAAMARVLDLPARLVGRTVFFDGEGAVVLSIPRYLFPSTAGVVAPTLPTPDLASYGKRSLPTTTCRDGGTTVYRGAAYTLAPLSRGYQWAPIAFWLNGDRIVTPRWFTSTVTGTWRTVSGTPARHGTLNAAQAGRPAGYGARPNNATAGVDCRWNGQHSSTTTVTAALAAQLGLPANLIGRRVALNGSYQMHAYSPTWLFPPAA